MSIVAIEKCWNYDTELIIQALLKIFDNLGGIEKFIKKDDKVVIKANLLMKKHPDEAVTTHPELIKALAMIIHRAGGIVTIVDSPAGIYSESHLRSIYNATGMSKVAEETGATLNFDTSEVEVDNPEGIYFKKLKILKPIAEADVVINVPKLKTHVQMVFTGAVKNMFGAIAGEIKARYHFKMSNYDDFANGLIDIFLSTKTKLNIMDAVIGMEGDGPSAGNARHLGLILASEDGFALDMTALKIINVKPGDVPVIKNAINRILCPPKAEDITIIGENTDKIIVRDFDIPQLNTLRDIRFIKNKKVKAVLSGLMPKPVIDRKKCVECYECVRCCPPKIISTADKGPVIDYSQCIRCFCCQEQCPVKAISVKRSRIGELIVRGGMAVGVKLMK